MTRAHKGLVPFLLVAAMSTSDTSAENLIADSPIVIPLAGITLKSPPVQSEFGDIFFLAEDSTGLDRLYVFSDGVLHAGLPEGSGIVNTFRTDWITVSDAGLVVFEAEDGLGRALFGYPVTHSQVPAVFTTIIRTSAMVHAFNHPLVNSAGTVVFLGSGPSGNAVFTADGHSAPRQITPFDPNRNSEPAIDDDGNVIFAGTETNMSPGFYLVTPAGVTNMLAAPGWGWHGNWAPGMLSINNRHQVLFTANIRPSTPFSGSPSLMLLDTNGEVMVISGQPAHGAHAWYPYYEINEDGRLAYHYYQPPSAATFRITTVPPGIDSSTNVIELGHWLLGHEVQAAALLPGAMRRTGTDMVMAVTTTDGSTFIINTPVTRTQAMNDYDGDGKTDIGVIDPKTWQWFIQSSHDGSVKSFQFGFKGVEAVPGHYDNDTLSDPAVYDPKSGMWFFQCSADGFRTLAFGGGKQNLPAPADYNGDAASILDVGIYNSKSGQWSVFQSTSPAFSLPAGRRLKPVPGNYFGYIDAAVFDPSSAVWTFSSADRDPPIQFGARRSIPVQADFDGDERDDFAAYDSRSGYWSILGSATGVQQFQFGYRGVAPVVGDYDGDSRADAAVFDPKSATWYIRDSEGAAHTYIFGYPGVQPIGARN